MPTLYVSHETPDTSLTRAKSFDQLATRQLTARPLTREAPLHDRTLSIDHSSDHGPRILLLTPSQNTCLECAFHLNLKRITPELINKLKQMSGCTATFETQKKLIKLLNGASNTIELIQDIIPDSGTISQIAPNGLLNFFCFNKYTEQYTNKNRTNQRLQSLKRKLHQKNDSNISAETKLAIEKTLDFINALEQKRLPENFPTDKQLNICEAIVEQDFAYKKAEDAPDDFDFFITNLYTQVNVGPIDMTFVRNLGHHIRKKANPIALEIYAGNGMLSRSLEEYGILTIAIDICFSHHINEEAIKTVYFSLATHAIYRFTALITTLRERGIPVSPFVFSIYPQSPDKQSFGHPMLDLFDKIPELEIITIGAKPLQHLAPNHRLAPQMKHCDLTEELGYRSNGLMDTTDRVYTNYTGMR